jgi:hypothetical protein
VITRSFKVRLSFQPRRPYHSLNQLSFTLTSISVKQKYPFDISNVANTHAGLPANNLNMFGIHVHKQVGDPFDPAAAAQAEETARVLMDISNHSPVVTPAVVTTAKSYTSVQFPHAFDVVALAAQFNNLNNNLNVQFNRLNNIDNRLDNIDQQLGTLIAQITNASILSSNRILSRGVGLQPLVKDVAGSGLLLAIQVNSPGHQLPQQLAQLQANAAAGIPPLAAALGQTPPFYNPTLDNYRNEDILLLIEFYNVDFGIVIGDALFTRKDKFRMWLTAL